jgi:hypothetical protein
MLRRAPTSISLSNRDVIEHLENIERKKWQDRENIQPKQDHKDISAPTAYELTDSLVEQLQKNEKNKKNEVTVHEYEKVNQQRAFRGGGPPFRFPQEIEEEGSCDENLTGDLDPDGLELGELLTIDACTNSEFEDNLEPTHPADPLGHLEERPVIRHEDSSQQASHIFRNTFDYGGFVEASADQSSSFRESVAKLVASPILPTSSQTQTSRMGGY